VELFNVHELKHWVDKVYSNLNSFHFTYDPSSMSSVYIRIYVTT